MRENERKREREREEAGSQVRDMQPRRSSSAFLRCGRCAVCSPTTRIASSAWLDARGAAQQSTVTAGKDRLFVARRILSRVGHTADPTQQERSGSFRRSGDIRLIRSVQGGCEGDLTRSIYAPETSRMKDCSKAALTHVAPDLGRIAEQPGELQNDLGLQ